MFDIFSRTQAGVHIPTFYASLSNGSSKTAARNHFSQVAVFQNAAHSQSRAMEASDYGNLLKWTSAPILQVQTQKQNCSRESVAREKKMPTYSLGCCNKVPYTGWLKTTEIYSQVWNLGVHGAIFLASSSLLVASSNPWLTAASL